MGHFDQIWATKYTAYRCKPAHQICVYMQEAQTEALEGEAKAMRGGAVAKWEAATSAATATEILLE